MRGDLGLSGPLYVASPARSSVLRAALVAVSQTPAQAPGPPRPPPHVPDSFISFAALQGVSVCVLLAWVGHVDREILDWYFHLADEQSQAAMQRLSRAAAEPHSTSETDVNSAQLQHSSQENQNEKAQ